MFAANIRSGCSDAKVLVVCTCLFAYGGFIQIYSCVSLDVLACTYLCVYACVYLCKRLYLPVHSPQKSKQGSPYRRFVPLRPRAYERLSSRSSAHIGGQGIKELSTQTKLAKLSLRRRANNIILRTLLDSITLDETIWPFDANPFWI